MISRVPSDTFSFSYASVSVLRVNVTSSPLGAVAAPPASTAPGATGTPTGDRVTLTPAALATGQAAPAPTSTAAPASAAAPAAAAASTGAGSLSPTPLTSGPAGATASQQKIARLIEVLDANRDGALSAEEFVDGAKRLLRGSRGRRLRDAEDAGDEASAGSRGAGQAAPDRDGPGRALGIEKRLQKAFDAIDANGDDALSADELVAALDSVTAGRAAQAAAADPAGGNTGAAAPAPAPVPEPAPAPAAQSSENPTSMISLSFTRVTYVSVAIQRYQSVERLAA